MYIAGNERYFYGIIKWYKEKVIEALFERKLGTMPPRRRRDRPIANTTMEEEMR
jgi:hypothetical protein